MMRTGLYIAFQAGVLDHPDAKDGQVPFSVFEEKGLPPIVACSGCGMTMNLLSPGCLVDMNDRIWCHDCAGFEEDEPTREIPEDMLRTLRDACDGLPDYFENEVDPLERLRIRALMGRELLEVTPEEEYDIIRDVLEIALLDRTVSGEAKGHVREALDKTFSAPDNHAYDQALDEYWGLLEGSLADPEKEIA
jgi:hypothetical protein